VAEVVAGQTAVPLDLMNAALRAPERSLRPTDTKAVLTEREHEVLMLVSQGMTNKQIARTLTISPATVKAHVERIIAKLGVSDRTQAAVVATQDRAKDA